MVLFAQLLLLGYQRIVNSFTSSGNLFLFTLLGIVGILFITQ